MNNSMQGVEEGVLDEILLILERSTSVCMSSDPGRWKSRFLVIVKDTQSTHEQSVSTANPSQNIQTRTRDGGDTVHPTGHAYRHLGLIAGQ